MMKVLVTGGTGFIGSELIPELQDEYEVYSLERYVTGRMARKKLVFTIFGDLRDYSSVNKIVREIQPDKVVHLASISPVSYSYDHPQEVIENNVLGTVNLVEACRRVPHFKHFLFAGTSEEYGNNGYQIQKEEYTLRPASPYAVSKVACEKYLAYLQESYDFPVTILRPFNTYGRKQDYHFLVENTVVQMLSGGEVRLVDPNPVRDWLYVEDHVSAYSACLKNQDSIGETFNFSTGQGVTVKDIVELIARKTSYPGEVLWHSKPGRPGESRVIIGDSSKARSILGWKAKVSLDEGLDRTIAYWRDHLSKSR